MNTHDRANAELGDEGDGVDFVVGSLFSTANEAYNTVTRTALAAREAVRFAESALAKARETADQAEAARQAIIAVMQRPEVQS